ncbi:MAG: molybdopterin molybdotransferase MoeA, partial [Hyphomicrobiales bacterium]|nr:molybdopterin molybdotransferase MoeA [Hyphomicrobiales bacterium]
EIARGICRRILTGAIVSPDVCAIVMEEHVRRNGSSVEIVRRPERGANIRRAGEDVPLGEVVIRRGTLLDARHAAMLAAAGTADLLVKRPLRVAVLSTGDELTGAAAGAGEGKIPDTNRPLLLSLLTGKAVEVVDLGIARDDRRALADRFIDASARLDLLVSTGGVSGSEADHVSPALRSAGGRCEPMRLALRPGKPISSGRLGAMTVVALPGNPVAALVGYVLFVRAVVRKLLGHRGRPVSWTARTAHVFEHRVGRTEFVPVSVSGHDDVGLPLLRKLGGGGSACLQPLVEADGFARISPDGGDVPAGEVVTFYPFSSIHQL